ncbi:hypothetical protein BDW22DRAFT_552566 [Trametopsis cervina]|nr:hypothetical protein BDW22DRAFT_552566 [Trametopsis cervina]
MTSPSHFSSSRNSVNMLSQEPPSGVTDRLAGSLPSRQSGFVHANARLSRVQKKWRTHAGLRLGRRLSLDYKHYKARLRPYNSPSQQKDMLPTLPQELYINGDGSPGALWLKSPEVIKFARLYGENITILHLSYASFRQFTDLTGLLGLFPFLKELEIVRCSWKESNFSVWQACTSETGHTCSAAYAPASLSVVNVELDDITAPLPLATWLTRSPNQTFKVLNWKFQLQLGYLAPTARALYALGSKLTDVTLTGDDGSDWDLNYHSPDCFPDLSHNTGLRSLRIRNIVAECVPIGYLPTLLSSLNSPVLAEMTIQIRVDSSQSVNLDRIGLDALSKILLRRDKFPALRSLLFEVVLEVAGEDVTPVDTEHWVLSKMPAMQNNASIKVCVNVDICHCSSYSDFY